MQNRISAALVAVTASCALMVATGDASASQVRSRSIATAAAGSLASQLPSAIKARGYIENLINTPNAPMEFDASAGGPPTGFDVELAQALGKQIGIKVKTTQTPVFSSLIPAVQSGRTDIVLSAITDLKSRQGIVSFVDYFRTGNQFLILKKDAKQFATNTGLCGQTVVASTGTDYPMVVTALSKKVCQGAGKPAMKILQVGSLSDQLLQLQTNRAVALMLNTEVVNYYVRQHPKEYAAVGTPINPALYGIIFPKSQPSLGKVLQAALNDLIKNGTYKKLLTKWGLATSALTKATINAGGSN
jgi:polar amino acid transport system substrate-binding protein